MKKTGEDRLGHEISNDKVRVCRSQIAAVGRNAISERPVGVCQLTLTSKGSCQDKRTAIERILTGDLELLCCRKRFVLSQAWRSTVIRDDSKDAFRRRLGRVSCQLGDWPCRLFPAGRLVASELAANSKREAAIVLATLVRKGTVQMKRRSGPSAFLVDKVWTVFQVHKLQRS